MLVPVFWEFSFTHTSKPLNPPSPQPYILTVAVLAGVVRKVIPLSNYKPYVKECSPKETLEAKTLEYKERELFEDSFDGVCLCLFH